MVDFSKCRIGSLIIRHDGAQSRLWLVKAITFRTKNELGIEGWQLASKHIRQSYALFYAHDLVTICY